jgi:hypothetical protein
MASERIFNIFVYFDNGLAREYGIRYHKIHGSDEELMSFLRANVEDDHKEARRFPLSRMFTPSEWLKAQKSGQAQSYFERGFVALTN